VFKFLYSQLYSCSVRVSYPGLFFIAESNVTGIFYLNVLEQYLMPVLQEDGPCDMVFQQDKAKPIFTSTRKRKKIIQGVHIKCELFYDIVHQPKGHRIVN